MKDILIKVIKSLHLWFALAVILIIALPFSVIAHGSKALGSSLSRFGGFIFKGLRNTLGSASKPVVNSLEEVWRAN